MAHQLKKMNVKQQWNLWLLWLDKHLDVECKAVAVVNAMMVPGEMYHWAVPHRLAVTGQLITKVVE
jgi:hypothetical protein